MKKIFFLLTFVSSSLLALPVLPVQEINADSVTFDEKKIYLKGNVKVLHEFGTLRCDESTLFLTKNENSSEKSANKIFLKNNVHIDFSDGSSLQATEGEIYCEALEAHFCATPPQKVIYITYTEDEHLPIRATSRALQATIVRGKDGYSLNSLKGEGAVNIEYLTQRKSE